MKIASIKTHLRPYSILARRRTTVSHAFASAIAPIEAFEEATVAHAIRELGQDPAADLRCVYCGRPAETWDHLYGLVAGGDSSGYGHCIRNLVPCCRHCNSVKGGKNWRAWLLSTDFADRDETITTLEEYSRTLHDQTSGRGTDRSALMEHYVGLRTEIFRLMGEADTIAAQLRLLESDEREAATPTVSCR